MSFVKQYCNETISIIEQIDEHILENIVDALARLKANNGRLFLLGVGGSAAHCSHAVCDFRKISGIEAYTPVDNMAELTARVNDEGWASTFVSFLEVSHLSKEDAVFVFSVGGGSLKHQISPNIVLALQYAKRIGATILGIVGRDGGYTKEVADACCVIPTLNTNTITPQVEGLQAVLLHLLVSHPKLKHTNTKWESLDEQPCGVS